VGRDDGPAKSPSSEGPGGRSSEYDSTPTRGIRWGMGIELEAERTVLPKDTPVSVEAGRRMEKDAPSVVPDLTASFRVGVKSCLTSGLDCGIGKGSDSSVEGGSTEFGEGGLLGSNGLGAKATSLTWDKVLPTLA
jgi:hypothetical protein